MAKKKKAAPKKAALKTAAPKKAAPKKAAKPAKKKPAKAASSKTPRQVLQQRSSVKYEKSNHSLHDIVSALPLWLTKNLDLENISTVEQLQHAITSFKSRLQQGFAEADRVMQEKVGPM